MPVVRIYVTIALRMDCESCDGSGGRKEGLDFWVVVARTVRVV